MTRNRRTAARTALVALVAATVGAIAFAAPASAHVTVNSTDATQGGYAKVVFRVPTESDTVSTTKVEVFLPDATPIASVATMPVPGWTAVSTKKKLATPLKTDDGEVTEAVTTVTWTASQAAAIKPGEFQEFPLSLGPLPKTDQLVLKAIQTYSDGNVVRWIEEQAPGAAEPQNPAPVLKLSAATTDGTQAASTAGNGATGTQSTASTTSSDSTGRALGIAGLIAGLLGLGLGGLAFARIRRAGGPVPAGSASTASANSPPAGSGSDSASEVGTDKGARAPAGGAKKS
jgi:uncharacterized protein YcnI